MPLEHPLSVPERGPGGEVLKTFDSHMTRTVALALIALFAAPVVAQPEPGGRPPFIPPKDDRFELFRGLLHFHGVQPVTPQELDDLRDREYSSVIVVVMGGAADRDTRGVEKYTQKALKHGGAVLIATDQNADLSAYYPDRSDVKVVSDTPPPQRASDCYAGQPDLPFAQPAPDRGRTPDPLAALLAGRPRVTMNRPGHFSATAVPNALQYGVARTPVDQNDRAYFTAIGNVGARGNPFRSLALSDPDILSNQMLYSSGIPDRNGFKTDNWTFANTLVSDFLRAPTGRTRCLFVEKGEVVTRFDEVELKSVQQMPPLPDLPLPNPLDRRVQAKLAELIDGGVVHLEDRTAVGNLLAGPPNDPSARRYQIVTTILAALAGLLLVGFMVRRLFAARHTKKFVPAPTDPLFLGDAVALGSFGQRRAELLRGTDFRAPFAHRVRAVFAARGLPAGYGARRLPPVTYRGRGDRERLGRDIRDLWDAAARDESVPLSYVEWKDLEPVLADVHAAAAADRWRFAPSSPQGPA